MFMQHTHCLHPIEATIARYLADKWVTQLGKHRWQCTSGTIKISLNLLMNKMNHSFILKPSKMKTIHSKNNKKSLLVLFGILITLLSQPLLFSITDITIQPYRFIPVIVFVSIGFGIICCGDNKQNQLKQDQL